MFVCLNKVRKIKICLVSFGRIHEVLFTVTKPFYMANSALEQDETNPAP